LEVLSVKMNLYILSMVILVLSATVYQLAAKFVPAGLSSWHVFTTVYLIGGLLCITAGFLDTSKQTFWEALRGSNWAVIVLGFAVVGIETGYLLAFRAGWKLSITGVFSNVAAATLMLPVGVLLLKERLSLVNVIGLILAVVGLILVTRRA
jgi:drug/metabolite transporter (DMT)-like permease